MSAAISERTESLVALFREYAGKLTELNRELQVALQEGRAIVEIPGRVAWLLDRAKRFDIPIRELVNHAAHVAGVNYITDDSSIEAIELSLRLGETEAQLHHMLRQAGELQKLVDNLKISDQVTRLRESAGLNAMKGGPLRPNP